MGSSRRYGFHPIKNKKTIKAVYIFLRLSVILVLVEQFYKHNYENVFLCVLVLGLFLLPDFLQRQFVIKLPDTLEIVILLFIYSAEILGEIREYYIQFPYWDIVLHTINGFLCAAIGFSLVDVLNRNQKKYLNLSPAFIAVVAFCFSMTIGVFWEFFEFSMDLLVSSDMQKDAVIHSISTVMLDPMHGTKVTTCNNINDVILIYEDGTHQVLGLGGYLDIGLVDTMTDLFVNFIGALVFSVIGFFYVKNRGRGWFARCFIPSTLSREEVDKIIRDEKSVSGKSNLEYRLGRCRCVHKYKR